jgi:hypothetical protein
VTKPTAYFIATNGVITIWRPLRRDRVFRSVTIKGSFRSWRAARPSGPNSFHAVRVKPETFHELLAAKAKTVGGYPQDDWVENQYLPASILEILATPPEQPAPVDEPEIMDAAA